MRHRGPAQRRQVHPFQRADQGRHCRREHIAQIQAADVEARQFLLDALQPGSFNDENEGFASKEAESIYDEVFFFTDERTLQLPENELVAELKKDNPDWFE